MSVVPQHASLNCKSSSVGGALFVSHVDVVFSNQSFKMYQNDYGPTLECSYLYNSQALGLVTKLLSSHTKWSTDVYLR